MQLNKDNHSFEILKFIFVANGRALVIIVELILSEAEGPLTCTANQYAAGFTYHFIDSFWIVHIANPLLLEKLGFDS